MKVDVYQSTDNRDRHYLIPTGTATSVLPEEVGYTVKTIDNVNEGHHLIGLVGIDAILDIQECGFHVLYLRRH